MSKDWTGNHKTSFVTLGASNHTDKDRAENDYYATDPKCLELLLERESFHPYVWECACGGGHLANVLREHGYKVRCTDIVDRGCEDYENLDFLTATLDTTDMSRDIITNPPYKYAKEFVEHALDISMDSTKVAMFLKITFLESKSRRALFDKYPPQKIYVFSERVACAKNGDFECAESSAVCYAWFIWVKGFKGQPTIYWI